MMNQTGLIAAILLVVLSIACGSFGSKTPDRSANTPSAGEPAGSSNVVPSAQTPKFRKPDFTIDPIAIHDAYDKDDRSIEKYKDKVVELTGKYNRTIGSHSFLTVVIESGKNREILCRMSDGTAGAVSLYKTGQVIKLTGIGDPYVSALGPGFKDCLPQP